MSSEKAKLLSQEIIAKVRENKARLDGCPAPQHDFQRIEEKLFSKWRCTHCSGELDAHGVFWYQKGLEHGPRNSERVL